MHVYYIVYVYFFHFFFDLIVRLLLLFFFSTRHILYYIIMYVREDVCWTMCHYPDGHYECIKKKKKNCERERERETDENIIGAFPVGNYTFGCRGSDFYHYYIIVLQVVSINVDESSVTSFVSPDAIQH